MDQQEQKLISELMIKLKEAEQRSGPRDRDAEELIADALLRQPAAPYYMAQVILVQDHAIQAQYQRIQELEKALAQRPAAGGSFLGGLFGAGAGQSLSSAQPTPGSADGSQSAAYGRGWSNPAPAAPEEREPALPPRAQYGAPPPVSGLFGQGQAGGGGFLSSALTTAAGVAGGMMAASALSSLFGVGQAHAAGVSELGAQGAAAPAQAAAAPQHDAEPQLPDDLDDSGGLLADNDGGDFDTFGGF